MNYKPLNGWTKESIIAALDKHLPKEGRCTRGDSCSYHHKGSRCAAGALLPGNGSEPWFEFQGGIESLLEKFPTLESQKALEVRALNLLQRVHDQSDLLTRDAVFNWVRTNVL